MRSRRNLDLAWDFAPVVQPDGYDATRIGQRGVVKDPGMSNFEIGLGREKLPHLGLGERT